MELDLGKEVIIKVKIGSETYELREPTIDDVEIMGAAKDMDPKEANQALQRFIIELGMPEEVTQRLSLSKTKKLVEGLTSTFSEGK